MQKMALRQWFWTCDVYISYGKSSLSHNILGIIEIKSCYSVCELALDTQVLVIVMGELTWQFRALQEMI